MITFRELSGDQIGNLSDDKNEAEKLQKISIFNVFSSELSGGQIEAGKIQNDNVLKMFSSS